MKIALATPMSLAGGILYVITAVIIFSIFICLLRWLRKFLPHPEEIKLGTEDLHLPIDIGVDGFHISDFVYYTAVGKTIDSCHRYLRSEDVEMLYKTHIDNFLAKKSDPPDQWKKPYLGHPTQFLFIGMFMNLEDGYSIHSLKWDYGTLCLRRQTVSSKYKLQPGDFIVAARSRD